MMNLRTAIAFLSVLASATTAAAQSPAASRSATPAASPERVDAIVDSIVDRLWEASDHYWHQGDYSRVVGLSRVMVEADPGFTEAWGSGAWLLWSMGDTAAADAFLQEGTRRSGDRPHLFYELGWHLFNTKRFAQALPHLEKAVTFPTADAQMWKVLGHTYDKLGRLEDAERVWKTVVARFPDDVAGPSNLARVQRLLRERGGTIGSTTPAP